MQNNEIRLALKFYENSQRLEEIRRLATAHFQGGMDHIYETLNDTEPHAFEPKAGERDMGTLFLTKPKKHKHTRIATLTTERARRAWQLNFQHGKYWSNERDHLGWLVVRVGLGAGLSVLGHKAHLPYFTVYFIENPNKQRNRVAFTQRLVPQFNSCADGQAWTIKPKPYVKKGSSPSRVMLFSEVISEEWSRDKAFDDVQRVWRELKTLEDSIREDL